jgi:hypothetical protein
MKLSTCSLSILIGFVANVASQSEQASLRRLQTSPTIDHLDLINSSSDLVVQTLRDGDIIGLNQLGLSLPNLNVQAVTSGTGIAAVVFGLNSTANFRTVRALWQQESRFP